MFHVAVLVRFAAALPVAVLVFLVVQDFIRKNSANKKTYKSAQSKQKVLDKILETAVPKPRIKVL